MDAKSTDGTIEEAQKLGFQDNHFSEYQRNRSRASPDGLRSENDKLKASYNMKIDEELNIEEYLDTKITQNAQITNAIKSTLSNLENRINNTSRKVISENNSSGENNEQT